MKKFGFTLAELLITLSIIGVVAAMTLPNLMANTNEAKIGPKLAKVRASIEQANLNLLNANSVDSLRDLNYNANTYVNDLQQYLKMTATANQFVTNDGVLVVIWGGAMNGFPVPNDDVAIAPNPAQQYSGLYVIVNLNGANRVRVGEDRFYFTMWGDGSLRPVGGENWAGRRVNATLWRNACADNDSLSDIEFNEFNAATCTGSIFENNLKVRYRID